MADINYSQTIPGTETNWFSNPFDFSGGMSSFLERFLINGDYAWLWNQYIKALIGSQEAFQQINQGILRAYGLPTREDLNRVNQQIYELNNRLDELEDRLNNR
jgi:hypothetical protein